MADVFEAQSLCVCSVVLPSRATASMEPVGVCFFRLSVVSQISCQYGTVEQVTVK